MKKRLVAAAMVAVMALTMVACSNDGGSETKEFSLGEWKETVYENTFLNMKYTLPEGWSSLSKEEIESAAASTGVETTGEQNVADTYAFMVQNPTTGGVMYLQLVKAENGQEDLDNTISQLESTMNTVQQGVEIKVEKDGEATLLDKTYTHLLMTMGQEGGDPLLTYHMYLALEGDYICTLSIISAAGSDAVTLDDVSADFAKLS